MVVTNALDDPRFADNPLVTGAPFIRFYAGAPLKHSTGMALGTLCLIDSHPKRLEPEELDHLKVLAHMVTMELQNQGRIDNCKENCLYGHLPMQCPYKDTKYELPE